MTTTTTKTAEVTITVTVDGTSKTFTATAETAGDPHRAARAIVRSTADDACNWTGDLQEAADKAHRRMGRAA